MSCSLGGNLVDRVAGNPEKPHVKFSTELKGHQASVEKVAFNPTKDAELCSVSADGVVKFWDVRTKECFNEVKGLGDALSLVWAPDGETLIVGNKVNSFFSCFGPVRRAMGMGGLSDVLVFFVSWLTVTPCR